MTDRFDKLKKIPPDPAAKLLSLANIKLETPISAPASAPVSVVLAELDSKQAVMDMLLLLAVALPPREAAWWACLAARDIVGHDVKTVPPPLAAAEAWVFKPSEENRANVRVAVEGAETGDRTVLCGMAALYAPGTLGPDDLSQMPVAPETVPTMVMAMNGLSMSAHAETMDAHVQMLIERGLDIARGGSGRIAAPATAKGAP